MDGALVACQRANGDIQSTRTNLDAFEQLDHDDNILALYLEKQNAGLLMYRRTECAFLYSWMFCLLRD